MSMTPLAPGRSLPTNRKRVGILISGRGTNMEALLTAAADPAFPAEIVRVISNNADAPGLLKAEDAGIATSVVNHRAYGTRSEFEDALHAELVAADVEILCNAGFMRLLTAGFVERWRDRHLNIHPSLLPAFRGLNTHERALEAGVRIAGATVHIVREEMDAGPIIAQVAVPVAPNDTADTLAARVLAAEHQIYPLALGLLATGRAIVSGERVIFSEINETGEQQGRPLISPSDALQSQS